MKSFKCYKYISSELFCIDSVTWVAHHNILMPVSAVGANSCLGYWWVKPAHFFLLRPTFQIWGGCGFDSAKLYRLLSKSSPFETLSVKCPTTVFFHIFNLSVTAAVDCFIISRITMSKLSQSVALHPQIAEQNTD